MDDGELMGIRIETSFVFDGRGRMLRCNEPDETPAPRLLLARTRDGDLYRFGHTLPDALAQRLGEVLARELPAGDVRAPPAGLALLRELLASYAPIADEGGGPAYHFPNELALPREVRPITAADAPLVRETFPWVTLAGWQPCFAVVRDGAAVSVCFSARMGARAAEAGVNTLPEFRGRGYAAAVTAAWGAAIRARGLIPLYSTSWDNLASQGVARRVGLQMFGADMHWT
ncbi:MAG TPA: GNAT family N-acetyltransferase [Dehalococcoidia bacterium]|jgi:hypothetical protein|nr:GNAT family N-acetyltransferase [Dehalococcoidia bacterium]